MQVFSWKNLCFLLKSTDEMCLGTTQPSLFLRFWCENHTMPEESGINASRGDASFNTFHCASEMAEATPHKVKIKMEWKLTSIDLFSDHFVKSKGRPVAMIAEKCVTELISKANRMQEKIKRLAQIAWCSCRMGIMLRS